MNLVKQERTSLPRAGPRARFQYVCDDQRVIGGIQNLVSLAEQNAMTFRRVWDLQILFAGNLQPDQAGLVRCAPAGPAETDGEVALAGHKQVEREPPLSPDRGFDRVQALRTDGNPRLIERDLSKIGAHPQLDILAYAR
jgi:hypothetical protein